MDIRVKVKCYGLPYQEGHLNGTVHSIFQHSINIMTDKQLLVTLYEENEITYPMSIAIEQFCTEKINIGDQVIEHKEHIVVGDVVINKDGAIIDASTYLTTGNILFSVEAIKEVYEKKREKQNIDRSIFTYLESMIHKLRNALESQDTYEQSEIIKGIIGCGVGLTPTGDDMLIGMMAFYCVMDREKFNVLGKVVGGLLDRTTEVSKKYLMCAIKGYFTSSIVDLFQSNDERMAKENAEIVAGFGSTSGTDSLYGIICSGV